MRFARIALCLCAAFALTVKLTGQAGVPSAPISLQTSEKHHVIGGITLEALATGRARIQFWVNTPIYLAKGVSLEADKFTLRRAADGSQLIESAGSVRLTGFALEQGILGNTVLQHAQGNVLTWDRDFKLQILADGTAEWFCCPR